MFKHINLFIYLIVIPYTLPIFSFYYEDPTQIAHYIRALPDTFPARLEEVDCIYVINLDKRKDRWEKMQTIFSPYGVTLNRLNAVNGWELSQHTKKMIEGPYSKRLRGGQFGCRLSHLSALQDAIQKGYETIWILEDDVEIISDIHQIPQLLRQIKVIDSEWDLFYTDIDQRIVQGRYSQLMLFPRQGQTLQPANYYLKRDVLAENLMRIRWRLGAHSILYSRQGMQKVFDYFTHTYPWVPLDLDIHYIEGIREYSVRNDIVTNGLNRTDSDTEKEFNQSNLNL